MLGDLEVKVPIIQGAMGVRVSTASLAAAVANYGGAGTLSSIGLGFGNSENETDFVKASREGLVKELRKVRSLTKGIIGVNILVAVNNYEDLARTAVEEKVDFIVSGAGLPLHLPKYTAGTNVKIIPIVSSAKAADVIIKSWKRRYDRLPDAVIVEGPKAGGHLGFRFEDLSEHTAITLEELVVDVIKILEKYEQQYNVSIPVVAAGGIFDGKDMAKFLKLGAKGVQMATRFVVTEECTINQSFKDLYMNSTEKDVQIIKSPVGMPGRAIKTKLIENLMNGGRAPFTCNYQCLKTCNPKTAPYCIAQALFNAVRGDIDNSVVFAGSNVPRVDRITTVKELMDGILTEANACL